MFLLFYEIKEAASWYFCGAVGLIFDWTEMRVTWRGDLSFRNIIQISCDKSDIMHTGDGLGMSQ